MDSSGLEAATPGRLSGGLTLLADGVAAEVVPAFEREGIPTLLIKGPALARWLYEDVGERTYTDADLLVPPQLAEAAGAILATRGFEPDEDERVDGTHARPWRRDSGLASVDLHHSIFGSGVPPAEVWPVVSAGAETMDIAGCDVRVPALPVRALLVCLHAAQHAGAAKQVEDLNRALRTADDELWSATAAIATRLKAELTVSAGLGFAPEGPARARRLGLPAPASAAATLAGGGSSLPGLRRMRAASGLWPKVRVVARELLPPPSHLRWRAAESGRSAWPLPLLYAHRVGRVARASWSKGRALRRR